MDGFVWMTSANDHRLFLYQYIQAGLQFITYLLVNINKRTVVNGVNYLLEAFDREYLE